jgi:hypothetical protein
MKKPTPTIETVAVHQWQQPGGHQPYTLIAMPGRIIVLRAYDDWRGTDKRGHEIARREDAADHLVRLRNIFMARAASLNGRRLRDPSEAWYIDALAQAIDAAWPESP